MAELVDLFERFLPEAARPPAAIRGAVAVALRGLCDDAAAAHPDLAGSAEEVVTRVAERLGPEVSEPASWPERLGSVHGADLWLALACQRGDARALARFDERLGADVDLAIKKSPKLGIASDEFRQLVRARLFVAEPARAPRIASYSGRGPLKGWVRVTAARLVLDLARADTGERPSGDDALFERIPDATDPEAAVLRARSREGLRDAMQAAFSGLTARERNLLRQRYLFDLSGDRIAALYGVHRGTAFAWIEGARTALLSGVRSHLGGHRRGAAELESLIALLGSRLDISLRGVMGDDLE